jgi:hypothetical protein
VAWWVVGYAPCASSSLSITALATMSPVAAQAELNPTQYFFYTPEKNLLSVLVWRNGVPRWSAKVKLERHPHLAYRVGAFW